MQEINLGQLTSLAHCKKCGCRNEITPNQENFICKACGEKHNLKVLFGMDLAKDCKEK